jgi:hypothetical protein
MRSMARQLDAGEPAGPNWVLLLAIVFSVEFWVFVTNELVENL